MSVFKDYAAYYDLQYAGKDYKAEAMCIHRIIQENVPGATSILNLGCGTGSHDFYLAELGYELMSVDLSPEMISLATAKKAGEKIDFLVDDIRTFATDKKFDVVISLFHVISYQLTNEDLEKNFNTVARHLTENGAFIFDCWYGPGVLSDPPAVRYKVLENEKLKIHRVAVPVLHKESNYVDVNYTLLVSEKETNGFYEVHEQHQMRYLFTPEVKDLAGRFGMHAMALTDGLFSNDWNALFLCKKKPSLAK